MVSRTSSKCSEKDGFSRYFRMFRDRSNVVYATAKGKEGSIGTASTPTCRTFSDESKVLRERWFLGQVQSVPRKIGFSRYFRMFRDRSNVVYATAKGKEGSIGTASTPTCRTFSDESKVLRERWFLGQVQSVPRKISTRFSRYFRMFRDRSKVVYATAKGKEGSIGTASTPTCRTFSDESKVLRERWFLGQVQSVPRKMVSRGTLGCSETGQRLCMQLPKAKKDPLAQQVLRPVGLSRTSPKCSEKDGFSDNFKVFRERWFLAVL